MNKLFIWHSSLMGHDINMRWHIALHMHGNITFHEYGCMVRIKHQIDDLMGGLGTIGRSPTESHGCIKQKIKLVSGNNKKG